MTSYYDCKKSEEYLILGNQLVEEENFESALIWYKQAIQMNAKNDQAYYQLGQVLNQLGRNEEAIAAYSRAITLNPKFPWSYNSLGELYIKLKCWKEAIAAYTKFIQLNDQFCWAYLNLGEALYQLNSWEEAVKAYQKAIKLDPKICWFYLGLGDAFMKLQREKDALQAYSQAIQLNPTIDWFYHKLADAFLLQNQPEKAIEAYQNAINLKPLSWYYTGIGKIYIQQEKLNLALECLIKALQIKPDSFEAYYCIASILEKQNQENDGIICRIHYQLPISLIQQICNLSDSQLLTTNTAPHLVTLPVYPASQIQLKPPQLIEGTLTPHFQFQSINFPEAFVSIVPKGRVWADTLTSAVMTSENQLITDLSTGSAALVVNSPYLPTPRHLPGTAAFLSVKWGDNFYHWMFDIIARFDLLFQQFSPQEIDWFVVNRCQASYERETLQLLDIPSEKIIESCDYPALTADQFLIPSYSYATSRTPVWVCSFLRKLCLRNQSFNAPFPLEKIYLSRSSAAYRHVENEAEVIAFLQQFGFTALTLESLSIQEQANFMANTKVIISPHGAGLTNLVFCSPQTQVIEFLLPDWSLSCYWELSNLSACNYYCLLCEPSDPNRSPLDFSQNIKVNLQSLLKVMKLAGIV